MDNPYCASFEKIQNLYAEHTKTQTRKGYDEWVGKVGRTEIKRQLDAQKGSFIDWIWKSVRGIIKQKEFVEFLAALQLADFYFPNAHKDICFELRRGVKPEDIKTYEDLVGNFENNTHIDCEVHSGGKKISFQIKRDYSNHTPTGFATWLNEKVLKKYGDMSGTTLVIFLGVPKDGSVVEIDKFYFEFIKECVGRISFDKICLLYHDGTSGHMALHEFYPKHHRLLIERDLAMARFRGDA